MGERTREGNDLMREMIEAGIMKYGDKFKHSMEEGGWDLDSVNLEELKESKATFVFGQMNEPPGALGVRVALKQASTLQNISVMVMVQEKEKTFCSL